MKTIKKYLKVAICFIAFAIVGTIATIVPKNSTLALTLEQYKAQLAINTLKVPYNKTVDAKNGETLDIPVLKNKFNGTFDESRIRVITSHGVHDYVEGKPYISLKDFEIKEAEVVVASYKKGDFISTSEYEGLEPDDQENFKLDDYFEEIKESETVVAIRVKNLIKGKYKIAYIVKVGNKEYVSSTYEAEVVNVENVAILDDVLLPTTVKTGDTIIVPEVKLEDGTTTLDFKVKKNAEVIDVTGNSFVAEEADYTIEYYLDGSEVTFKLRDKIRTDGGKFKFSAKDDYKKSQSIEITTMTVPSFSLGATVDLSNMNLTVKDDNKDNINYRIKGIEIQKDDNSAIKHVLTSEELKDLKFDFTVDNFENVENYADMTGKYKVIVTVETYEFQGENAYTTTRRTASNVLISEPKVYYSYDYDATITEDYRLEENVVLTDESLDATTELKQVYDNNAIYFPAAYATDNVSDLTDLFIERTLVSTSNPQDIYYIDNLKYVDGELIKIDSENKGYNYYFDNHEITEKTGKFFNAQQFEFKDDASKLTGTFKLVYKAYRNIVEKKETSIECEIKLNDGPVEYNYSGHSISINKVNNDDDLYDTEKLIFEIVAKDVPNEKNKNEYDKNLKNAVFYYTSFTGNRGELTEQEYLNKCLVDMQSEVGNKYKHSFDNDTLLTKMVEKGFVGFNVIKPENNKYTFDPEGLSGSVNLVAVSLNNYGSVINIVSDVKKINIIVASEDNQVPTVSIENVTSNLISGGEVVDAVINLRDYSNGDNATVVKLPTVKFTDNNAGLTTDVKYYINEVNNFNTDYLSPSYTKMSGNNLYGGEIQLVKAGLYYVVYTATDIAGNTQALFFTFTVVDNTKPNLTVETNAQITDGVIDFIYGSDPIVLNATMSKNDEDVTSSSDFEFDIDDFGKGLGVEFVSSRTPNKFVFKPTSEGEYKITVKGKKGELNSTNEWAVIVKVTKNSFAWADDSKFDVETSALKDSVVDLRYENVRTNDGISNIEVNVKKDGKNVDVIKEGDKRTFVATENGTYTVTYSSKATINGVEETIEKVVDVKVGDSVPPIIKVNSDFDEKLGKDISYNNADIEFKVDLDRTNKKLKIKIVDKSNNSTILDYDTGLVLQDKKDGQAEYTEYSIWTADHLKVELVGETATDGVYTIDSTGTYTLKITAIDGNKNVKEKLVKFKVVAKADTNEQNDNVAGIVLIVISLVVLAGVILFFALTGKKTTKAKSNKKAKSKKVEKTEDIEVEEVKAEVEDKEESKTETKENAEVEKTEDKNIVVEETKDETEATVQEKTEAEVENEKTDTTNVESSSNDNENSNDSQDNSNNE